MRAGSSGWRFEPPPKIAMGRLLHLPTSQSRPSNVVPLRAEGTLLPPRLTRSFDCPSCGFVIEEGAHDALTDGRVVCPNNECGISFAPPIS